MYRLLFLLLVCVGLCSCVQEPVSTALDDPTHYTVEEDVVWASPAGWDLTMDIYTPNADAGPYPVIVMFHGGGWLINDNSIMDQAAKYLATNARYVVCNVNYRLLSDGQTIHLNNIVEDAFGAVLWVKDHIGVYGGDRARVIVTGDSAGAHLSAMVVNAGKNLSSDGFAGTELGFAPSYLPVGSTPEQVASVDGLEVQAAILSYGGFDVYERALAGFEGVANPFWMLSGTLPRGLFGDGIDAQSQPAFYQAVSPAYNVPTAVERTLPPQLLTAGSEDTVVSPASVQAYLQVLQAAGHAAEYWEHAGRPHAFLDSGSNAILGIDFASDAPPALDVMIAFLDEIFYPPH